MFAPHLQLYGTTDGEDLQKHLHSGKDKFNKFVDGSLWGYGKIFICQIRW